MDVGDEQECQEIEGGESEFGHFRCCTHRLRHSDDSSWQRAFLDTPLAERIIENRRFPEETLSA
jgi:hypothetical protein